MQGEFILLAGPSGVGKGPLTETLFIYMQSIGKKISKHVLYTDRKIRPGEKDGKTYHFLTTKELRDREQTSENFKVFQVREQLQGIDIDQLSEELAQHDLVFLEIFHERIPEIIETCKNSVKSVRCVFLTPLSEDDFENLGCGHDQNKRAIAVQAVMWTKLINRNTESLDDILVRATSAFQEITNYTGNSETILVNHFGEDVAPLWEKLQQQIKSCGGLDAALNDSQLKYIAETFDSFLNKINHPHKKNSL
jgi:guanylate kinase